MFLGGVVVFSESKMDGSFHGGSKVAEEPRVDFLWHHNASILIRTEAECGVSASFNTWGQKLTLFGLVLICLNSGTRTEWQK